MHITIKFMVNGGKCLATIFRGCWAKPVLRSVAESLHNPGQVEFLDDSFYTVGETFLQGNCFAIKLIGQHTLQGSFHHSNGQGVTGQRPADAANICIVNSKSRGKLLTYLFRKAVNRSRHSSSEGLADHEEIRLKTEGGGISTGAATDRVSLINNEIGPIFTSQFTQRFVITRLGVDDPDIGHDRLGKDCCYLPPRERRF